jgi:hypothetical protein
MDGMSLLGFVRNARLASRRAILIESPPEVKSKLQRSPSADGYQLYAEYQGGDRELYDLRSDPQQLRNQASNGAMAVAASLKRRLSALRNCRGPASGPARRPGRGRRGAAGDHGSRRVVDS